MTLLIGVERLLHQLDDSGLYFGKAMQKYWQTNEIDFDLPNGVKVIRTIEYNTPYEYILGIIADGERHEFLLTPKEKKKSIYIKSQSFVFYIRSDNNLENIRPPKLEVDFIDKV